MPPFVFVSPRWLDDIRSDIQRWKLFDTIPYVGGRQIVGARFEVDGTSYIPLLRIDDIFLLACCPSDSPWCRRVNTTAVCRYVLLFYVGLPAQADCGPGEQVGKVTREVKDRVIQGQSTPYDVAAYAWGREDIRSGTM